MDDRWWIQLGYYPFDPGTGDDAGYPMPGQVVKYYRQQQLWKRKNGSEGKCRQLDLAEALGVTESWVRAMESKNEGLDSIARRRLLVSTLGIPAILLGIGSPGEIPKDSRDTAIQLSWYRDSLIDSWQLYYTGGTQDLLERIVKKIDYLQAISTDQKGQDLQCRFYLLAARVVSDQQDYGRTASYLKSALKIATSLQGDELIALALFWRGRMYLEKEDFPAAKITLDKALKYASYVGPTLRGAIYLEAGLATAYTAPPGTDTKSILSLLDKAVPIIRSSSLNDEGYFVHLNMGRYHHFKAEALIALHKPDDAMRELDLAEQHTSPTLTRRRAYINILRAKASLDMGDFPFAAYTALDALGTCKAIRSDVNVTFISEIAQSLAYSNYGNSSEVVQLKRELSQLR